MSSGKPTTPISSPKISPDNAIRPSTPPIRTSNSRGSGSTERRSNRLSANYLKTPEQSSESQIPFSPSLKRTNSGTLKSPDYKLNHHNVSSPYNATSLLKTPRHSGYDSDDNKPGYYQKNKLQKTPQFFSSAKKLFQNDDSGTSPTASKEDLSEISLQLKSKLSSALGKIQRDESHANKISFTELTFDSATSPTKKVRQGDSSPWTPSTSIQKANLNLQTLQQSPVSVGHHSVSPNLVQPSHLFPTFNANSPLKSSPLFKSEVDTSSPRAVKLPSPDEESSAHSALLAALSRQRRKSRVSASSPSKKRSSLVFTNEPEQLSSSFKVQPPQLQKPLQNGQAIQLPSLNVALKGSEIPQNNGKTGGNKLNNEQDAVLSLMSLSSPQSIKFSHSRNHSVNDNSPISSESPSLLASPINSQTSQGLSQQHPILPPISGLIHDTRRRAAKNTASSPNSRKTITDTEDLTDNDETDIDDEATDEDI